MFSLLAAKISHLRKRGIGNYIGICIIVAVFGTADAHIEGGMVGDLSLMCPEFIQVKDCCIPSSFYLSTKHVHEVNYHSLFLELPCSHSLLV